MRPTRIRVLLAAAIVAGVLVVALVPRVYASLPPLPVWAPVTLLGLSVAEGYASWAVGSRLRGRLRRTRPIDPLAVARAAALAKASSLVGALTFGGYAGLLGWLVHSFGSDAPGADVAIAALGVGASLLLVVGALLLERACRVPPDDDEQHRVPEQRPAERR